MRARAVAVRAIILVLAVAAAAWAWPRYAAVWVGGDSMAPALRRGDLVVVRRGGGGAMPGDIALVNKDGWPAGILHRVETVLADGSMTLRGDANPIADPPPPVAASRLRGITIAVIPFGTVIEQVRRQVRRWYNAASHTTYRGDDGEATALRAPPFRERPATYAARASGWRVIVGSLQELPA
jgi:signal peptidase I